MTLVWKCYYYDYFLFYFFLSRRVWCVYSFIVFFFMIHMYIFYFFPRLTWQLADVMTGLFKNHPAYILCKDAEEGLGRNVCLSAMLTQY